MQFNRNVTNQILLELAQHNPVSIKLVKSSVFDTILKFNC